MSAARGLVALALGVLLATPALAESAVGDGELGRLFFTPARRQLLDRQREAKVEPTRELPADPTLTINGVVTRSSGKRTVWINDVAHDDDAPAGGVSVSSGHAAPGRVVVRSPDAPAARARVGDTINRSTGETTGLLGDGYIATPASRSR